MTYNKTVNPRTYICMIYYYYTYYIKLILNVKYKGKSEFIHVTGKTMSIFSFSVVFAIVLYICSGAVTFQASEIQDGWIRKEKTAKDTTVCLYFAIKQTNRQWLKDELYAVSYPNSPRYGQYSNFDEIAKTVHGRPESISALEEALSSVDVKTKPWHYTIGKDFAVLNVPVYAVEKLFNASFYNYVSTKDENVIISKSATHVVPTNLVPHLDFVFGISEFPRPSKTFLRHRSDDLLRVTPQLLEKSYNISGYTAKSPKNSQAIASFLEQYFNPKSLEEFQKMFKLPEKPIVKIVGENKPNNEGIEASLDVEYISAMGRNVNTWFVSTPQVTNHSQEDFLSWIILQVNTTDSPWVHSVSYDDLESSIPLDFKDRIDVEFQKFGVSGRSVMFASGDSGVDCYTLHKYHPVWPASAPHVTSVGGVSNLTEVWFDGGGGFSNTYSTPDYQKEVVEAYLKSGHAPPSKVFNSSGRAYPDVSAFSVKCEIFINGVVVPQDGTSCASPTFAGIVSLLNDIRLMAGKPTLGFLNPLLYQTLEGKGFIDVTEGNNGGGRCEGFKAIKGWDPASGWGGPNFGILRSLI